MDDIFSFRFFSCTSSSNRISTISKVLLLLVLQIASRVEESVADTTRFGLFKKIDFCIISSFL